jgi:predicted transposase/invertase (TIGR01784 family)
LLSFINLIFADRDLPLLSDIEVINPRIDGSMIQEKSIVLDIRARTTAGEQINIEIQLTVHRGIAERAVFYWGRQFGSQLLVGQAYEQLKRTVSIFVLNFVFTDTEDVHSVYRLLERDRLELLTDKFEIHFIELPKLRVEQIEDRRPLLRWLAFLRDVPRTGWEQLAAEDIELRKVMSTLEYISQDLETRLLAEAREKALNDQASIYSTGFDDGVKKGVEEGKAEGKAEGIVEGEAKGAREKALAIAIGMLNEGISSEIITKLTGVSRDELENLKK